MSGSGISWTICKSAPSFRQTASHHSVFYRSDALPAAQPTASKHWRHVNWDYICSSSKFRAFLAVSVSNALVMLCWLQVVTCRRTLTQPRWRSWINRWWRWWIHEYCSRWVSDLIALCITAVSNSFCTSLLITALYSLLLLLQPCNDLFSGATWVSRYQKGKTSLDLNEARDDGVWDGSGISWTVRKQSAPRSRQITTPTPHHSIFTGRLLFPTPNQQCQSTEAHQCFDNLGWAVKRIDDL